MTAPRSQWLMAKEIARICGVSERTLRLWVGPGHPRPFKRHRRGSRYYFDPGEFAAWLAENEKHDELARLNGYLASLRDEQPPPPRDDVKRSIDGFERGQRRKLAKANREAQAALLGVATAASGSGQPKSGMDPAQPGSWDIFSVRDNTAQMYTQAVRMFVGAPRGEKIAHAKNANAVADLLRKLELDCIEVAKQMRLVILVSDAEKLIGRICARVKHDLMNLPHACAADLADMSDAGQITAYLESRVTDALRHLSDALKVLEVDRS